MNGDEVVDMSKQKMVLAMLKGKVKLTINIDHADAVS